MNKNLRLFMLATKPASICFIIEVQKIKPVIHEQWNVYLIITWSVSSTKYQPLQHDAKKKKKWLTHLSYFDWSFDYSNKKQCYNPHHFHNC